MKSLILAALLITEPLTPVMVQEVEVDCMWLATAQCYECETDKACYECLLEKLDKMNAICSKGTNPSEWDRNSH